MADVLRAEGIHVYTGTTCRAVRQAGGGIVAELSTGPVVRTEGLLVATGRGAALHRLGVESIGLSPEATTISTDEHLRAADHVWAVGDITGHGAFTHVAYYQAQIAAADILEREHPPADYSAVPRVTFTDPEVAGVGLSEAQAGRPATTSGSACSRSSVPTAAGCTGPALSTVWSSWWPTDRTGQLLGGSVMAPSAGEVIGFIALAIRARIPISTLEELIYPYPTFLRAVKGAIRRLAPPLLTEPAHEGAG